MGDGRRKPQIYNYAHVLLHGGPESHPREIIVFDKEFAMFFFQHAKVMLKNEQILICNHKF